MVAGRDCPVKVWQASCEKQSMEKIEMKIRLSKMIGATIILVNVGAAAALIYYGAYTQAAINIACAIIIYILEDF